MFLFFICYLFILHICFFFFFQAEDGIRDKLVTGVQTCALPIFITRLGVTPADNTTSLDLRDKAEEIRDQLREQDGKDFDRAYLRNEIKYHEDVLEMVDKVLIPSAMNGDLRNLLTNVRPAFAAHLEHAKQLQKAVR